MTIWMKVTRDKYQLPVAVGRTAQELGDQIGVSRATISSTIYNAKKRGYRCQYVKVEVDDDEEKRLS